MPGRGPILTRTRCPDCGTVFRVTSEQLRLKAGKVRCGQCHAIFNAFDQLLPPELEIQESLAEAAAADTPEALDAPPKRAALSAPGEEDVPAETPAPEAIFNTDPQPQQNAPEAIPPATDRTPPPAETPVEQEAAEAAETTEAVSPVTGDTDSTETPEETTQAARAAGLVAVRELADSNHYDRWSAGALADGSLTGFSEPPRQLLWPYLLMGLLLTLTLAWQAAYHFRAELVLRMPVAADLFAALDIPVPLPREAALVSIESSDLQADQERGLFVLNATLKNRAPYAQAWPDLELTLTDSTDRVVARRVVVARDYLSPGVSRDAFAANGETAVRLWIEASDTGAAGYRLYIFYP